MSVPPGAADDRASGEADGAAEDGGSVGSSPYATGGGGVRLEHEYAGAALTSLLLGTPLDGLGDDLVPERVALQQEARSPVDDIHVDGRGLGGPRTLRVACRRRPTLAKIDASTVKLFADFVAVVLDEWQALEADSVRLGLAVSAPFTPATELATLTEVARRQPSRRAYAEAIRAPRAYTAAVRTRLTHLDHLVAAALAHLGRAGELDAETCAWRLLRSLYVLPLQLEGDVAPGRTALVSNLTGLAGDPARANALRIRLVEVASGLATRAGGHTRTTLRRELRDFGPLGPSAGFARTAVQIAALEQAFVRATSRVLPAATGSGGGPFTLERAEIVQTLVEAVTSAPGGVILLRGEADVGKSAVALAAAERLREAGASVAALSLRDLPGLVSMLPAALGAPPEAVFADAPSAPTSVLLLDGAEVVQEGDGAVAGALLAAAAAAGRTTVLVVRDDAADAVRELALSRGDTPPTHQAVPPLGDEEVGRLVAAVPALARYAADDRAVWLLRRLGLVELLLRAARRGGALPAALASEADVFAAVWHTTVRQGERVTGGVSPDDREQAVLEVSRALLIGEAARPVPGPALAALRSDSVLRSRDATSAWQVGDRFGSDVLRDFAMARLLLRDGLTLLAACGAPRWAVRAARLVAQVRLAEAVRGAAAPDAAGDTGPGDAAIRTRWAEVTGEFTALTTLHGARWGELPWEAVLTAGWSPRVLAALAPQLRADGTLLAGALACVERHFSTVGAHDPVVATPVVAWLVDAGLVTRPPRPRRGERDAPVHVFVRAWLAGLTRREYAGQDVTSFRSVRARARDALLAPPVDSWEAVRLECLGLLGADATAESAAALRALAADAPERLGPLVESADVAGALAHADSVLLVELTEAYYLEQWPAGYDPNVWAFGTSEVDDGIRHHVSGGMFAPLTAWYLGPFVLLFRTEFARTLALLNRMLERGAVQRARVLAGLDAYRGDTLESDEPPPGIKLDLLGLGSRRYLGDAHVWQWYRRSSVGPYPCMSALSALELVLDEFVRVGVPPVDVARRVLREATTIASVALVMGFLVRHLDEPSEAAAALDGFLAAYQVWQFELSRVVNEQIGGREGTDPSGLTAPGRRRWPPAELATRLVVGALRAGDESSLARLRAAGERLVAGAGGAEAPATVRHWAVGLDARHYVQGRDGDALWFEVAVPADIQAALDPARQQSARVNAVFRLLQRYQLVELTPYRHAAPELPDEAEFVADVRATRELAASLADGADEYPLSDAVAGVAAAVVEAGGRGRAVEPDVLRWGVGELVAAVYRSAENERTSHLSVSANGADRRAALALPGVLLLPPIGRAVPAGEGPSVASAASSNAPIQPVVLSRALAACTRHPALEVRAYAVGGLRTVFAHACTPAADGRCVHESALEALEAGARNVVLGAWAGGRRAVDDVPGGLAEGMATLPVGDLRLSHIAVLAAGAMDAARGAPCVRSRACEIRDALLRGYTRAAPEWAAHHYSWRDEYHAVFGSALLHWADHEDGAAVLVGVVEALSASVGALAALLRALLVATTYERVGRSALAHAWPAIMRQGLAMLEQPNEGPGGWRDLDEEMLLRHLVPAPTFLGVPENLDAVLAAARQSWVPLDAVALHVPTWIARTRGRRWCVDALVGFLQAQPTPLQTNPGLTWVRELVVAGNGTAHASGYLLVPWLRAIGDQQRLDPAAARDFRALVDALAASQVEGARALQRRDE